MTPQQAPQQGGGDIFDAMGELLMQMVEMAGPEWTMQFLQAGMEAAQQGGDGSDMTGMQSPQAARPMPTNAFASAMK